MKLPIPLDKFLKKAYKELNKMSAELLQPSQTSEIAAAILGSSEQKDILQATQERLLNELASLGNDLFEITQRKDLGFRTYGSRVEIGPIEASSSFSDSHRVPNEINWIARVAHKFGGNSPADLTFSVATGWEKEGRFRRKRVLCWGKRNFDVISYQTLRSEDAVLPRKIDLRVEPACLKMNVQEDVEIERPLIFMSEPIKFVQQDISYYVNTVPSVTPKYDQLFITRGDDFLPKVILKYCRGDEPSAKGIFKLADGNIKFNLRPDSDFAYSSKVESQSMERLREEMSGKYNEAGRFLLELSDTFPKEVDVVSFLEDKFGLIFEHTKQVLEALKAKSNPSCS